MAEAPGAAAAGSVRIGAYSLEVATRSGSFAQFQPEEEHRHARELAAALDEERDDRPAAVAAVEDFQESADAVTGKIERADKLLKTAADGRLLELDNISGELDALLDLFARLDSEGRFEEQLRLMRSLNGLLALAFRWLELVRSLRALLRSAEAAGHTAGRAWAHHELGSLNLCAGRSDEASSHLAEALRLEEQLADAVGRCATRHNLDSARRDLALRRGGLRPPKVTQRLVIFAAALVAAGAGGAGIALAIHGHDHHDTTTATTVGTTSDDQAPTTPAGLRAVAVSSEEIDLSWLKSTDNVAVTGYVIYRDHLKLTTVSGTTTVYRDTGLAPATGHVYSVQALDAAGNASPQSGLVKAKTPPAADTLPPSAPTNLQATAVDSSTIDLTWTASTDNVAVTGYVVYRDGVELTTVAAAATTFRDTGLDFSTRYLYTVQAVDAAGNRSPQSKSAAATTGPG